MKRFNHMYTIAFTVINDSEDGETTTGDQLRTALLRRLRDLSDDELVEAVGYPDDTYEELT